MEEKSAARRYSRSPSTAGTARHALELPMEARNSCGRVKFEISRAMS